jgi:hypothetical protein
MASPAAPSPAPTPDPAPVLVFDGGCPFCRHFAEVSELRSGIAGLTIVDGRADGNLRQSLAISILRPILGHHNVVQIPF